MIIWYYVGCVVVCCWGYVGCWFVVVVGYGFVWVVCYDLLFDYVVLYFVGWFGFCVVGLWCDGVCLFFELFGNNCGFFCIDCDGCFCCYFDFDG